jgi:hypothetical protein
VERWNAAIACREIVAGCGGGRVVHAPEAKRHAVIARRVECSEEHGHTRDGRKGTTFMGIL